MNNDKLVVFMYILMRDYLPCGSVAEIFRDHVDIIQSGEQQVYSNKHLEAYAIELVNRLE